MTPYYRRIALLSLTLLILIAGAAIVAHRNTTAVDIITHTAVSPMGIDVPVESEITVTFTADVDRPSAEQAFVLVPPASGTFQWRERTLIFIPDRPLAPGTTYVAIIGRGLRDADGNLSPLSVTVSWLFTTR